MSIASINPATGELTKRFDSHTDGEIESALARAVCAFEKHRRSSFAERAVTLQHAAEILEKDREHLARIITTEMGKLLRGSIEEIEKCARGCRFYAEHGEKFLAGQIVSSDAGRSYVRYEPLGAVLAIMPWNFPYWQVFRFAAPALMAGNVGLLKHASSGPQAAPSIEDIFRDAGFSQGCFQTLPIGTAQVTQAARGPRTMAATVTGRRRGRRVDRRGFFFEPTVFLNAKGTRVWKEEVFGPVAAVARAKNLDEAIALGNDAMFGLGSAAFTQDAKETERLIEELEAGQVFIN